MRKVILRRSVLASIAALPVAAAGLGIAGAQQSTGANATQGGDGARPLGGPFGRAGLRWQAGPGRARHDELLAAVAKKLNVTPEALKQAFQDARKDLGLPSGPRGGRAGMRLKPAADLLGLSIEDLWQKLQTQTLTDIASAQGVDPGKVAQALKDAAYARIDQAAQSGRVPQDQVAQLKKQASDRIDQLMTRKFKPHPFTRSQKTGLGGPGVHGGFGFGWRGL